MKLLATACLVIGTLMATVIAAANPEAEKYWPQWRGPHATGVAVNGNPPIEWSETKNIRWKVEIPGRGSSSPVVWGDRLFLLTAMPAGVVTAASAHAARRRSSRARRTGSWCWRSTARTARSSGSGRRAKQAPHEASHQDNGTWASSSAITDGEHVIASFESFGIYGYDMNGTLVWQKDLGDKRMRNEFGEGSTPALHGNIWSSSGIIRTGRSRSSSRSTSGPARNCGGRSATRSTRGRRRSSSSTKGARRSSSPA